MVSTVLSYASLAPLSGAYFVAACSSCRMVKYTATYSDRMQQRGEAARAGAGKAAAYYAATDGTPARPKAAVLLTHAIVLLLISSPLAAGQDCPPGSVSAGVNTGSAGAPCVLCSPGSYSANETDAMDCTACPAGRLTALRGAATAAECLPIVEGHCAGNTDSATDVRCPPGEILLASAEETVGLQSSTCCETCPSGTFSAGTITRAESPCTEPLAVTAGDTIGDSDGYATNTSSVCEWHVSCASGPAEISFQSFSVEGPSDFVNIFDGPGTYAPVIATLHGTEVPPIQSSSGAGLRGADLFMRLVLQRPLLTPSPETCAREDLVLDWTVSACSIISLCAAVIMSIDTV